MSSFTSSSEGVPWRCYFRRLVAWTVCLVAAVYGVIVVVDPFDTLVLSPPLDRVPIATNQRYSYPALARSAAFDSVVIGTSTSRLLRPATLDGLFDSRFANLSMNSATAYEQFKIGSLFARHHLAAKAVLIGVDIVWCQDGETYQRYTFRPFPEWMYDDDPWNDFREHFDFYTLEQAGRQLATMVGLRRVKYGRDGYTNFLPNDSEYDPVKVRRNLWGEGRAEVVPVDPPVVLNAAERAALRFPTHALMEDLLNALPAESRKVLFFVPYHLSGLPAPGSDEATRWAECKGRLAAIARRFPNTVVVDFMRPSPITTRDENYWDRLHYTLGVADRLAGDLFAAAESGADGSAYVILDGE